MSLTLLLIPEAKQDAQEAFLWYEERSNGLGIDFLSRTEEILLNIQENPKIYPVITGAFRRAMVTRFPYMVIFELDTERSTCIIYAIFHCSQNPHKWRKRIRL